MPGSCKCANEQSRFIKRIEKNEIKISVEFINIV